MNAQWTKEPMDDFPTLAAHEYECGCQVGYGEGAALWNPCEEHWPKRVRGKGSRTWLIEGPMALAEKPNAQRN